ncbi:MAG: hypothetical protein IJ001_06330 [Oscillospiraceae bacterium]|nr:hypothetical protein [Oscillospiraceae bacterium]
MSIHVSQVYDYLESHPLTKYEGEFESLLEMLHYIYTTANPIVNDTIRERFQEMGHILKKLSVEEDDALHNLVCDLCLEHEQLAFAHGITVGMYLMTEINALPQ